MSAVSNSVMPSSSALCTTARVCSASHRMPKLLHPRPTADTLSPELPSLRNSMIDPFSILRDGSGRGLERKEDQGSHLDAFARRRVGRAGRILEGGMRGEASTAAFGVVALEQ